MPGTVTSAGQDQRTGASPPPAPRGSSPTPPNLSRFRPGRAWIAFFIGLLVLNFYLSNRAAQPSSRVRIPYSPFFLQQVTDGHVKEITSKGTTVQGTFKQKQHYRTSKPTTRF